ncbi:YHYH protein [Mariniblastus sp.]|nr:YHYH protein [Mariniblastus sp.]
MLFNRPALLLVTICLLVCDRSADAQISDPAIVNWFVNTTGATGSSPNADIDSVISGILADVEAVYFTDDTAYIQSSGVPSYSTGPFRNNSYPSDLNATFQFPRTPQADTTGNNTEVGLGPQGIFVNGVAIFNFGDGRSFNNQGIWNQDANVFEAVGFDDSPGHPASLRNGGVTTPEGRVAGRFHHHQSPTALRAQLGDDGASHSPIIGFAFDGFPIYGPYGYEDPNDPASAIVRMVSGYALRDITDRTTLPDGTVLPASLHGPSLSEIALGGYAEDYIFNVSNGHLDERNGRLTNTPEYPNGTYAYFITVDEAGDTAFPHILGETFYGVPVSQRNVTLPGNAVQFIPPSVLGDFSNDGVVDVTDIDFYSGLIGVTSSDAAYDERLDFDINGTIELSDHDFHVNTYVATSNGATGALLGDMDFDGTVSVLGDAFILIAQLNSTGPYSYGLGDLNADQAVDVLGDAFILIANLGLDTDP